MTLYEFLFFFAIYLYVFLNFVTFSKNINFMKLLPIFCNFLFYLTLSVAVFGLAVVEKNGRKIFVKHRGDRFFGCVSLWTWYHFGLSYSRQFSLRWFGSRLLAQDFLAQDTLAWDTLHNGRWKPDYSRINT